MRYNETSVTKRPASQRDQCHEETSATRDQCNKRHFLGSCWIIHPWVVLCKESILAMSLHDVFNNRISFQLHKCHIRHASVISVRLSQEGGLHAHLGAGIARRRDHLGTGIASRKIIRSVISVRVSQEGI